MTDDVIIPKLPTKLGPAGRRLWRSIARRYELRPDEMALLEQAARTADDAAAIVEALRGEPAMVLGSAGQPVGHPLRRELRETRLQLSQLLARLDLPEDGSATGWDHLSASQRARKAARVRWDRHGA